MQRKYAVNVRDAAQFAELAFVKPKGTKDVAGQRAAASAPAAKGRGKAQPPKFSKHAEALALVLSEPEEDEEEEASVQGSMDQSDGSLPADEQSDEGEEEL